MQGKTINGFELKRMLGRGGMAEVWYAENEIGKPAAVKLLNEDLSHNAQTVDRFRNEAVVMVALDHPNIRQVYGYGTIDGRPCIIMEYLEGNDLKARMKCGQRFSEDELERWWNQLVDALNYTHAKEIVHRDIKPSNIFIDKKGEVKLLDFGIAKVREGVLMTQTGAMMGTLMYMSPEQVQDSKHIGSESDTYSLAVTFVHLLTGKAPYDNSTNNDYEIRKGIVEQELDLSALPSSWRGFLKPYLAKKPSDRPALRAFEAMPDNSVNKDEETVTNEELVSPPPQPNDNSKDKTPLWITFGALVALALLLIMLWPKKDNPNDSKDPTLFELDSMTFYDCQTVADYRYYIAEYGQDAKFYAEAMDSIQRFVEDSTQRVQHVQDSLRQGGQRTSQNTLTGISTSGTANGHDYVDLGLPSGTLWATCNIGASKPEDYGDYYAWGETTTKNAYTWENYKYANGDYNKLTKYCDSSSYGNNGFTDNLTTLQSSDDPATVNWGSSWQTPSKKQWDELLANTTHKWTKRNGVKGHLFTSKKNGQTLFLPAAGYRSKRGELSGTGSDGGYWSRSLCTRYPHYAWYLYFDSENYYGMGTDGYRWFYDSDGRGGGFTVRPVLVKQGTKQQTQQQTQTQQQNTQNTLKGISTAGTANGHEYVDFGLPSGTLWATCNIGASKPEDYGNYYAWGETSTKSTYNWESYRYAMGTSFDAPRLTKYCSVAKYGNNGFTDNLAILQSDDDPATANWGSSWQTPSETQWDELLANTTNQWTTQNGVKGLLFTSKKNGRTLFLPAAGYREGGEPSLIGSYGYYWSRSLVTGHTRAAWYLGFNSTSCSLDGTGPIYFHDTRCDGFTVRPVRQK